MAPETDQFSVSNDLLSIKVNGLAKRFNREWIFKNLNYAFQSGKTYAITGPNGSGKSTLLQILWGQLPPTAGTLNYAFQSRNISEGEIFRHVSIAAPYMDLIEEFTLKEQVRFHFRMRSLHADYTLETFLDTINLTHVQDKNISNFSSGMKQRLKLGLAFYTEADVIFLDEPGTNLDEQTLRWYHDALNQLPKGKLVLIASNQRHEYPQDAEVLNMMEFK